MLTVAIALAGVLGSAFALVTGVPNKEADVNTHLEKVLDEAEAENAPAETKTRKKKLSRWVLHVLSVKPGGKDRVSHPLTFGIWAYVVVASWVALTYFLNVDQTPPEVQGIATAFAGYVLAVMTVAYGVRSRS